MMRLLRKGGRLDSPVFAYKYRGFAVFGKPFFSTLDKNHGDLRQMGNTHDQLWSENHGDLPITGGPP